MTRRLTMETTTKRGRTGEATRGLNPHERE